MLFQAFSQSQQESPLFVKQYTTEDGLSNASITSIIQDAKGFMWIGTEMGLNRFDGNAFKQFLLTFDQQEYLGLTNVSHLFMDRDGSLWVASDVLTQYISEKEYFSHQIFSREEFFGLPGYRINALCQDLQDRFWIATHEGMSVIDKNTGLIEDVLSRDVLTITPETINYLMQEEFPADVVSAAASLLHKNYYSEDAFVDEFNQLLPENLREIYISELLKAVDWKKDVNAPLDNSVRYIKRDDRGGMWIVYSQHGLSHIDPASQEYRHFTHVVDPSLNPGDLINNIVVSDGMVWIATTQEGLKVMEIETGDVRNIELDGVKYIHHLMKEDNIIWVSTSNGLFSYCTINETVQQVGLIQPGQRQWLRPIVKYTYRDDHDNLWIGTEHYGLLLAQARRSFHSYDTHIFSSIGEITSNVVRATNHDSRGRTWVGYSDGRVELFNNDGTMTTLNRVPGLGQNMQDVHAIFRDKDDNMWVGSYQGGLEKYDINGNPVVHYKTDCSAGYEIPGNDIRAMTADGDGNLLVAIQGKGFAKICRSTGQVSYVSSVYCEEDRQQPYIWIWALLTDSRGRLWLAGNSGLTLYDIESSAFEHFQFDDRRRSVLSIRSLTEDPSGLLWLSTDFGVVVFNPDNQTYLMINQDLGLSSNITASITSDINGNIWAGTIDGLNLINNQHLGIDHTTSLDTVNTGIFSQNINSFYKSDGLISNHFIYNSVNRNDAGWLYFGTSHGVVFFHPDSIILNSFIPPVYITGISLFNKEIGIGDDSGILDRSITSQRKIKLKHNQNSLSFTFSALNFINAEKNQYAYILEGFENGWNYTGSGNVATYTNLRHGHYRFRVRAANNDGLWADNEAVLDIIITPPFYLTHWAFFGYMLFVLGILFLLRYIVKTKTTARMEIKRMQEIDNLKSRFFTNIAHEIRTPLLLISGPLDNLLSKRENFDWKKDFFQVHIMHRNIQRLQHLVNQFLDFRRIDTGGYSLKVVGGDIISFVKEVSLSFSSLARQKDISFSFQYEDCDHFAWFDPEVIETVVTNLVSNAIKFTPENGQVRVELRGYHQSDKYQSSFYAKDFITISVIDSGPGIAPEMREKIFERYLRIRSDSGEGQKGTGIGLSIVKEMVELHKGKIKVSPNDPENYGRGSTFTVYIPHGESYYSGAISPENLNKPLIVKENQAETVEGVCPDLLLQAEQQGPDYRDLPTVLIVEDDPDTRLFLNKELLQHYKVIEAGSAEEGLELARNCIPDVVISDIMLPGICGDKMCQILRSEIQTDHIPVILLTAKVSEEDRVSGFKCGADAYLTKPFRIEELLVRINNLVETRDRIINKFSSDFARNSLRKIRMSSEDRFMQKVLDIVQDNISNPDLDVDFLTVQLGMSRAQLYRKFNSIIKQPVKEFVRTVRLKKAEEMMMQDDTNISGIAYAVGFSSPPYFTRCFKATYGVTPSEYMQKKDKLPLAGQDEDAAEKR